MPHISIPTLIGSIPLLRKSSSIGFDHPISLDIETDANEIIDGLKGLNEAVALEKSIGNAQVDARMACVLPVSVTHSGLKTVA